MRRPVLRIPIIIVPIVILQLTLIRTLQSFELQRIAAGPAAPDSLAGASAAG